LIFRFRLSARLCCFLYVTPSTTYIYTLSLHDALPILPGKARLHFPSGDRFSAAAVGSRRGGHPHRDFPYRSLRLHASKITVGMSDRKSTRLNSSHGSISYAVFCLKKKKQK